MKPCHVAMLPRLTPHRCPPCLEEVGPSVFAQNCEDKKRRHLHGIFRIFLGLQQKVPGGFNFYNLQRRFALGNNPNQKKGGEEKSWIFKDSMEEKKAGTLPFLVKVSSGLSMQFSVKSCEDQTTMT